MMTPQKDSVKLDSEATGIPGPASIISASSSFIGDNSGSNPVGLFLYLLWNPQFQTCFPILGALNTLLAKADPEVVQEGSLDWGANAVPLPAPETCRELPPSPALLGGSLHLVTERQQKHFAHEYSTWKCV